LAVVMASVMLCTRAMAQQPPVDTKAALDHHLERGQKAKPAAGSVARVRKGSREVTLGTASSAGAMRTSSTRDTTSTIAPPPRAAAIKRKG
jgi:hypothetical protein